eukprot:SAG31_NODE_40715_length_279_cov_0.866667_1_plen_52_part_10
MFGTYRLGFGSFIDVHGPYCYRNHNNLTENMDETNLASALDNQSTQPALGLC